MATLPNTMQEYFSAGVGDRLAQGITDTFGKNTAADLAIYVYSGDAKKNDPHKSGGFDQDAMNLRDASLREPGPSTLPNGRVQNVRWLDSAAGQDIVAAVTSVKLPDDRLALMDKVEKTLGGEHGANAKAALQNFYSANDDFAAAPDNAHKLAAQRTMMDSLNGLVKEVKSSVDDAHNTPGAYTQGIMGNSADDFAKMNGPTARANMEIHTYAAARAAQLNSGDGAFNQLELAARAKTGNDHGAFMSDMLKPENADKLTGALDLIAKGGTDVSRDIKDAADNVRTAQSQVNKSAFTTAVSTLSHAQVTALWSGFAYNEGVEHGNPDETKALGGMGFGPRPAPQPPAAAPAGPAGSEAPVHRNIFHFPPAEVSPTDASLLHKTSVPAGAPEVTRLDLRGLNITGGEEVDKPAAQAPVVSRPPRQSDTLAI